MGRLHKRYFLVEGAKNDVRAAVIKALHEYDLTKVERLKVISEVMSEELASMLKYMVREERHGDSDTPGDRES